MKHSKVLLVCIAILSAGCTVNVETARKIKLSSKYTDQIPITVEELKAMLYEDTAHYQAVVIYSVGCPACEGAFRRFIVPVFKKTDSTLVKWYFIQDQCGALRENPKYLKIMGLGEPRMYYIRDDTPDFSVRFSRYFSKEIQDVNNRISNFLFPGNGIDGNHGYPMCFIVNKQNNVKLQMEIYSDGVVETGTAMPLDTNLHINELDFHTMDTVCFGYKSFRGGRKERCTEEQCR